MRLPAHLCDHNFVYLPTKRPMSQLPFISIFRDEPNDHFPSFSHPSDYLTAVPPPSSSRTGHKERWRSSICESAFAFAYKYVCERLCVCVHS